MRRRLVTMLEDVRVLELSSPATMLAGQILGDLGADVICIEPPAGSAGRRFPPFAGDRTGIERSLTWHGLNRNKRGMTLDTCSPDGRAIMRQLLDHADIVLDASENGTRVGAIERPKNVVYCLIDAFSPEGPKATYRVTDPVLMAAGGAPAASGEPDRPPLFFSVPQGMMEAGAEAAVAALAGLSARDRLDVAQTVRVDARISAMFSSMGRLVGGRSGDKPVVRHTPSAVGNMPVVPAIQRCSDGFVTLSVLFLPAFAAMSQRIATWLADEGELAREIADMDLARVAANAGAGAGSGEPIEALLRGLALVCGRMTKDNIAAIARQRRFMAAPIMDMSDIAGFEHYRARGLFATQIIDGVPVAVPARFAQFSNFNIEIRRSAPSLSQHTLDILSEFTDLSTTEVQALFVEGVI